MKSIKTMLVQSWQAPYFRVTLIVVIASTLLIAGMASIYVLPSRAEHKAISGTGSWVAVTVATLEPLEPSCLIHYTRIGTVDITGVIEAVNGRIETHGLANTCVTPNEGTFRNIFTLDDATVAGRKGSLVMETKGTFKRSSINPLVFDTLQELDILSGSGGLGSIRGRGIVVTSATETEIFANYWVEIHFDGG